MNVTSLFTNPGAGRPPARTVRRREDIGQQLRDSRATVWDVIPGTDLDGLWYGYRAALLLTKTHGASVRLYANLQLLARLLPALDAHREDQWWQGIHVLHASQLQSATPAPMALAIFDAVVPQVYLKRRHDSSAEPDLFHLARLADQASISGRGHLHQGDPVHGTGFVKPSPNAHDLRCVLRDSAAGRAATVRRVRLSRDARPDERVVVVSATADSAWREWISVWRKSEKPVRVLVLDGLGRGPALAQEMRRSRDIDEGNLSMTLVDGCNWSLGDDLLWLSDLVLTSDEDIVMRAMACGAPVLYRTPDPRLDPTGLASAKVLGWQLRAGSASAALSAGMATLCVAWQSGRQIAQAWHRFSGVWDEAQRCADATPAWLLSMPDAIDRAVSLAREQAAGANVSQAPAP
jgi:hypothetical protein